MVTLGTGSRCGLGRGRWDPTAPAKSDGQRQPLPRARLHGSPHQWYVTSRGASLVGVYHLSYLYLRGRQCIRRC